MNVLVTGSSGFLGQPLARALSNDPRFESVIGVDVRNSPATPARAVFVAADVRHSLTEIVSRHRIDSVVHAAFVVRPIRDANLMEDINVNGSKMVFESCKAAGVKHLLHLSSATVYGFHADNPARLSEDHPVKTNLEFIYGMHKRQIEHMLAEYAATASLPAITVLRPSFLIGPSCNNLLLDYLCNRLVFMPSRTAPLQFTHIDDIVEIIRLLLLKRIPGVFNVGADGALSIDEMCLKLQRRPVRVPYAALHALDRLAWRCRAPVTPAPAWTLQLLRHSWVVSSDRLKRETGYAFRYTSRSAFEEYADRALWSRGVTE
ncbi:MAG TPA: NAD-dependent epimerase/dehydratase family protein [Bryobacteraceae bacterium]|nr:NAD-dependent epimerase/dehydratase family protein [Bryobacteraceae bacterium]